MENCPYCNFKINESSKIKFCAKCQKQVKCSECGYILFKDNTICLSCGFPLQESKTSSIPMNTFSLQEKQSEKGYSRNINLSFTNEATLSVASTLSGYVPFTAPNNHQPKVTTTDPEELKVLPPFQVFEQTTDNAQESDISIPKDNTDHTIENNLDINSASNYFEQDEAGFLISKNYDYKGKNKKIQQHRFIMLYIWAYKLLINDSVSKEHLNCAAKKNGIYDKNYPTYLKDIAHRFLITINDTFKLNPAGENEVSKIINEIQDPELKGFEYCNSKKRNSLPRINQEDEQKIEQWIQKESRFDHENFDIRSLTTARDLGIFALYDLTKELNVEESIKPGLAIEYLFRRYKTISKAKKVVKEALANKKHGKYFARTDKGTYYLSPEVEEIAKNWLNKSNINL